MEQKRLEVMDFKNMLLVKNQLAFRTMEELEQFCQDEKKYATFIDSIALLINHDEGFLALDESFIMKIEEIINHYRFAFQDSAYLSTVNGIICQINLMKGDTEFVHTSKLEHYLGWQEDIRMVSFTTEEELIISVADDAVVYHMMETGNETSLPASIVYSSLNYFAELCPKVFEEEKFYQHTMNYLDTRRNRLLLRKKEKSYISEIKENIQKVKKDS